MRILEKITQFFQNSNIGGRFKDNFRIFNYKLRVCGR